MGKTVKVVAVLVLLLIITTSVVSAEVDEEGNLAIKNDYISIFVNQNEQNRGRFAIDVTGGAPMRDGDDGKPLVYGRPNPWTSYTTIKIDGENYAFGGETEKRAGKNANYGEQVQKPKIKDNKIITKYRYDEIIVTQILSFVKSTTTGLPDTAQIHYRLTNEGEEAKEVGTRIMIDTMLGENDGAPFRIENEAITSDKLYSQDEVPNFWQAFDTLNDPKVTAQGTIKGPGLTTPDEVYFSDWGSLADESWDFEFNPEEEFMRKGEHELDSAMALFWGSKEIAPGETEDYVTNYGLGGITVVPGLLSLGITSPAELVMDRSDKKAQIVAYVQNTAEIEAENVEVELDLPEELELKSEDRIKKLDNMESGDNAQVMWEISSKDEKPKNLEYDVKVTADNTDDNQVTRELEVVGPPNLGIDIEGPKQIEEENNHLKEEEFTVYGKVTNVGNSTAYGVDAAIALPPGLEIASGEKDNKFLGKLNAGETVKVPWVVDVVGIIDGELPYSIEANSNNTANKSEKSRVKFPKLKPKIKLEFDKESYEVGDYATANINLENITDLYQLDFSLKYNKNILESIYVSRGKLFVDNEKLLSFNAPDLEEEGLINDLSASLDTPQEIKNDVVAQIHFKVLAEGDPDLEFEKLNIYDSEQHHINVKREIKDFNLKEE